MMVAINEFLVANDLRIARNPCVSPDFCLDWASLSADLRDGTGIETYPKSHFTTADGDWWLAANAQGDHAWLLEGGSAPLEGPAVDLADGRRAYPATWRNLLVLKNRIQEADPGATIFPTAEGRLGRSTIGVGARFTWPAVRPTL